ncbi:MAG: type III-A CRISPR-associated RAMP protein Csm3 [Gemmiger sp.]
MYQKYLIRCTLVVRTGMHIGGSAAFSAIGAVDSPVVRDPYTGQPIVPGSSLKGKLRTLLARSLSRDIENMPEYDHDEPSILRLFGAANPVQRSRLQFADAFVTNANRMAAVSLTEVKTENGISRGNAVANPRQIERVVAGTEFGVNIVYDAVDPDGTREDLALLAKGMKLLQLDYLGGHGSRGSGRVSLLDFHVTDCETGDENKALTSLFDEVANYELFPDRAVL